MSSVQPSKEIEFRPLSGFVMIVLELLLVVAMVAAFAQIEGAVRFPRESGTLHGALPVGGWVTLALALMALWILMLPGFFVVNPNMSRVLTLFGRYRGTVRTAGFFWTNPFTMKRKLSLRAHTLNGQKLKVNDLLGNPIEIAAVVVWQVQDTAQAMFDVEEYLQFVEIQSETAVRHLTSSHPYDDGQAAAEIKTSLRGSRDEISAELQQELQQRLARAGIHVIEARLSHLAYAPEIASAMLQRQQASAIIAARQKIVEGAVGMVEHALQMLSERKVLELDPDHKAQMVSNLLVVLCGHVAPSPVLNTGTLFT